MKQFLKKVLSVFLGILILCFVLDIFISHNLRKSDAQFFSAWNDLYSNTEKNDMVFIGSSRAFMHYNPSIFDSILNIKSFNCGLVARGISTQVAKYHAYCRLHDYPKYLIINLDICIFQKESISDEDRLFTAAHTYREQFFPYYDDRKLINELEKSGESIKWYEKIIPLIRYAGYKDIILEGFGINKVNHISTYKGFYGFDYKDDWDYPTWGDFKFKKEFCFDSVLHELINECVVNNITPIFVMGPAYSGYMQQLVNKEEAISYMHRLADYHQAPLFDYTQCYISDDSSFFCDPIHLNRHGADEFSKLLAKTLQDSIIHTFYSL